MFEQRCVVKSCTRAQVASASADGRHVRGSRACVACVARLRKDIARLPHLYQDCEEMLVKRPQPGQERVRGSRSSGISLDGRVVAVRADIMTVMASWAGFVAEHRPSAQRPEREVTALARFMLVHLDWLSQQPCMPEAVTEFRRLSRAAEEALSHPSGGRALGACERPGCTGTVYAHSDTSTPAHVSCDRGHRWPPSEWLRLSTRLGSRHRQGVPADVQGVAR